MDDHRYFSSDTSQRTETTSMEKEYVKPASHKRTVVLGVVNTAGMKSANVNRKRRWDQPPEELESSSKKVCVVETETLLKNEIESPSSLSDTNIGNNSELSANSSSSVKLSDCYNENLTVKYNSLSDGKNPEPSATLKQLETDVITSEAGISTVSKIVTPERTVQPSSVVSEDSDAMLVDETINVNSSDLCKDSIDSDGYSGMVFSHVSTKASSFVASKCEPKETHTVETRTFVSSMSDSLKQIQFYDGGDSNTDSEDFDKLNETGESRNSGTNHDVGMSPKDRAVNMETTQSVNDKICTSEEESKNQFSLNIKSVDESIDKNVNSIVNSNSVNISYRGNKNEIIESESEVHSLLSKESSSEGLLPVQNETEVSKTLEPWHCLNINLSDITISENIHDGTLEFITSKNICQNENKTDLSVTGVKNSQIIEEFENKEHQNRLPTQENFLSDPVLPDVDSQKQKILQASLNPAETSSGTSPEELMTTTSKLKKADGSCYLLESSNHISIVDTVIEAKEKNESKDNIFSPETADKFVEKNKIEEEPDFTQLESQSFSNRQSGVCNEDDTLKEKNVDSSNFKAKNVVVVMDISEESEIGEATLMATNSKGLEDIKRHEFIDSAKISQEVKNKDIINDLKVTERCVEPAEINPIISESPTAGKVEVVFQNLMKPILDSASHDASLLDIPLPVTPCSSASSAEVSEGAESKISIQKSAVENVHNNPEIEGLKKLMEGYPSTEPILRKDLVGESRISEKLEDKKKVLDTEKSMGTSIISITESTVSEVFVDLGEVSEKNETSIEVTSATNIDPVVMEVIFGPNDKASSSDDHEVIPYNTLGSVDSDDEVLMEKQEAGSHHPDSGGLIKGEIVTDHGKSVLNSKQSEQSYSYNKHDRDIQIQNSEILLDSAEIVTVDPNKPLIEENVLISDTSNDSDTGRGDNNLMTEIDNYIDGTELDKTSPFDVKSYKVSSDESNDGESKTTYETAKTISDDQDKDDSDNVEVKRDPSNNCELSKEETEETMESVYFDANQKDEVSESEDPLEGAETRSETLTNLIETQKLQEEQNLEDFLDSEGANEKDMTQTCTIRSRNLTDYIEEGALKVQQELTDVCNKEDNKNKSLQIVSSVVEEMEINFEDIPLESCDKGINQLEEEKEVAGNSVTNDIELNPENDRDSKETLNDEMKTLVSVDDSTNYLHEDGTPREVKNVDVSQKIEDLDDETSAEGVNCITDPNQSEATNVIKNLPPQSISISNERKDQYELLEQEKHEIGQQQIDDVQALAETKALQLKPKRMVDVSQEIEGVKEVNESGEMEISLGVETIQRCEVIKITNEKEAVSLMPLTDELLHTGSTFPAVEKKEFVGKEDQEQEIISTVELECVEESQEETSKPVQETEDSLAVKSIVERSDEEFANDQMDVDDNLELEISALKQRKEIDAAELDGYQQKMEDSLEMECTSLLGEVEYEIEKEFPKETVQESLEKVEVSETHKIECPAKDEDTPHSQNVEDIPEIVKMKESKTIDNSNKIKIPSESQLIENILSMKVTEQAPAESASNKCQVLEISERKLKEVESDTIVQVTSELQEQESKLEVEQEKEVRFVTQTFPLNQEVEFAKIENSKQQKDDVLAMEDRCNTEKFIVPEKEGLEQKVFDILTMISNTEKSGKPDIQLSSKAETRTKDSQDIPLSEKFVVIEPVVENKNKKETANQEAPDSSSEQIHLLRVSNKLSAVREQYISEEHSVPEVTEILEETAEQQKEINEPKTEDSNNKDNTPITPEEKMAVENSCHTFKDDDFSKICAQSQDSKGVEIELEAFTDNLQDTGNSRPVGKVIKEFILEDPVIDMVKRLQHSISEEKEVLKEDDIKTSPKQARTEDVNKVECLVVREEIIPSENLTAEAFNTADCTHFIISKATNQTVEDLPEEIIADDIIESIRVKDDSEVVIETEVMDSISGEVSNENQEVMEIDEPSDELKQSQGIEINTQMNDDDSDRNLQSATPPPTVLDENNDSVQIVDDACTESKPNAKYQYYKEKSEEMSTDGQANTKSSRVVCKENVEITVPEKDEFDEKGISLLSINVDQNVHNMDERLRSDRRNVAIVPLLTTITNENQQKSEEASKRVHLHSIAPCSDEPQKQQPLSPLQKLEPITLRIYKDNLTIRTDGLDSPKKHRSPILSGELKTQLSPHLKGSTSRSSLSPQNKQLEFTLKIAKDANTNFPKATMSPKSNMSPSGSVWKTDLSSPAVNKESQSPSHGSPTSESTLNRLKLKICKPNESTEILTHSNVGFPSNSLETNPTIAVNCSDSSPSESTRGLNTQCSQMEEFRTPKSHLKLGTMFMKMLETQENIALSSSSINSAVQPDTGVAPSESAPQPPPPAPIIPTPRKRGRPRKIVPSIPRLPTDPNNPLHHSFTVPDSSSAMSTDGGVNTNRPMRSCRGRTKPIVIATRKPRGGGMMRGGGRGRGILRITPDRETLTEYEKAELAKIEERKERLRAESIARYEAKKAKKLAKKLKDEERRKRLARERAEKAEAAAPQVFEEETRMSASDSSYSRGHTPATFRSNQACLEAGGEESQNSISNTPSSGLNKRGRMEIPLDFECKEVRVDQLAEYYWQGTELSMIQEQISLYLGVKSFKRKYPDLKRRPVEAEERTFLEDSGLVPKSMCDLGLTAVSSAEVLDIMFHDFPDKYEEFRKYVREKQAQEVSSKQKALASLRKDGSKIEPREQALEAVAAWNANLNRERKEERRCALDLQTFTIHYPQSDRETMTRPVPKVGLYPIALIPGQFCDYYKQYTPTELMYFPLNTVLYGPLKPNERHQGNGSDDGSGSDSDTSTTDESSDSSTESSDTSDEQEEAKCKICKTIKRDSKDSQVETLIQCAQCKTTSHPSCQDFTDEMLPHIKKYDWVCTDCKQCLTCKTRGNVEKILCCDLCDRGHHVECLGLKKVPERWHCSVCSYCSNCGTRDPGGPDWQHEYKKDEKGMKVYQRTLCASCCNNLIRLFEYYIESSTRPTNKPV